MEYHKILSHLEASSTLTKYLEDICHNGPTITLRKHRSVSLSLLAIYHCCPRHIKYHLLMKISRRNPLIQRGRCMYTMPSAFIVDSSCRCRDIAYGIVSFFCMLHQKGHYSSLGTWCSTITGISCGGRHSYANYTCTSSKFWLISDHMVEFAG